MALSRFVLTSTVTVAWPATWAELVNGGFSNSAGTATVGTSPGPEAIQVSASAPSGGQAGTVPQATFLQGTVIYADSSAGSTGPQQLYQAIGSGNLRPFVDGQDDVGHACLSN